MSSSPARPHTNYGKAMARRTIEGDHRFDHHDGHADAFCRLCVEEHFEAKARTDGWPR